LCLDSGVCQYAIEFGRLGRAGGRPDSRNTCSWGQVRGQFQPSKGFSERGLGSLYEGGTQISGSSYASLVRCEVKAEEVLVCIALVGLSDRNTSGDVSLERFRQATMQTAVQVLSSCIIEKVMGSGAPGGGCGGKR